MTKDSKDLNSYQKFIALIEIVNKILLWDMWQKIQFDIEIWKQDLNIHKKFTALNKTESKIPWEICDKGFNLASRMEWTKLE